VHPSAGDALLLMRLAEDVADLGQINIVPNQDCRNMTMDARPGEEEGKTTSEKPLADGAHPLRPIPPLSVLTRLCGYTSRPHAED